MTAREPCDVFPIVTAMIHILEAPLCDEAEPSCGGALALQLVTLAVFNRLTLALAKLAQRLNVRSALPLCLQRILFFPNFCSIVSVCLIQSAVIATKVHSPIREGSPWR